jgi:arylsulfatase A-like enzyme
MNRRQFCLLPGAALLSRAQSRPPNIVHILTDDLGWGDLGCYGNTDGIRTPNLDAFAKQGTRFLQFYSSNPVCSPSRTGWMTGQFPARHRIHGHIADEATNQRRDMPNHLDPRAAMLPRELKRAGYATGHVGKWHLGHGAGAPMPDAYGFNWAKPVVSNNPAWPEWGKDPWFWSRSTRLFVDEACGFVEKHRAQPFYLNLWTLLPHATLNPADEQLAPFAKFSNPQIAHKSAKQIYYASVFDLDEQIGRFLRRLDDLDLAGNTLVVFSSDNGPEDIHISNAGHSAFGTPGPFRGRKRSLYEGGIRMPLIARYPGQVPAGRVDADTVVTAVDWLPTCCRAAAIEPSAASKLDGEDMSEPHPRTKPLFWEWRFRIFGYHANRSPMLAMRQGNWKLLMNPDRSRVELYDIPRDPGEINNRAEQQPGTVEEMSRRLLAWQKELPPGMVEPEAGRDDYNWPR